MKNRKRILENSVKKIRMHEGPLSYSIVVYTAKTTLNQLNHGNIISKSMTKIMTMEHIFETIEKILIGRELDQELTERGLEFLNRFLFTSKGNARKTKDLKYIPTIFFEVVKNFSYFTFGGFSTESVNYAPIWTVHSKDGRAYSYLYTGGRFTFSSADNFSVWEEKYKSIAA